MRRGRIAALIAVQLVLLAGLSWFFLDVYAVSSRDVMQRVGLGPAPSTHDNVVLIVLDTVGRDHLSVYGYDRPTTPYLEQFGAQGTRFDDAISTSAWTVPSHASMFTGLHAWDHGATQVTYQLDPEPPTLAELLRDHGYETAAFSGTPAVSAETGMERGFTHFVETWRAKERGCWIDGTLCAMKRWFGSRDTDKPFFVFVNLVEAHYPYTGTWESAQPFFESEEQWVAAAKRSGFPHWPDVYKGTMSEADMAESVLLYDVEVRWVDAIVRDLVGEIERWAGPETTIIVTADHGETFGELGHAFHVFHLYDPLIAVPLIARGPGFPAGTVEPRTVQVSDLFRTILGITGAPEPAGNIVGADLRALPEGQRTFAASYAWPSQVFGMLGKEGEADDFRPYRRVLRAGVEGQHKLVRDSLGAETVYLRSDESVPLPLDSLDPALLSRLREAAGDPANPSPHEVPSGQETPSWDPEQVESLRLLGYLEEEPPG